MRRILWHGEIFRTARAPLGYRARRKVTAPVDHTGLSDLDLAAPAFWKIPP
jgi:hypothetical protein